MGERAYKRRYTEEQRQIMADWYGHTAFEFMEPDKGEKFADAIMRNRNWLLNNTQSAMFIGEDYLSRNPSDLTEGAI